MPATWTLIERLAAHRGHCRANGRCPFDLGALRVSAVDRSDAPARWNADEFEVAIAADAPRVVAQILRDEGRPMNAGAIKARLAALGLSRTDAERAWKRAQPKLTLRSDVHNAASRSYEWVGDDRPDGLVDET